VGGQHRITLALPRRGGWQIIRGKEQGMGNFGTRTLGDLSRPPFSTRPRRLLLIGSVETGEEDAVIEAHTRLPADAAAEAGIESVEAFVGSGPYARLLEIDTDDAQEAMGAFLNDARTRAFLASLSPLVSGFPDPDARYAPSDAFHDEPGAASAAGAAYSSADLPLAASMFRWRQGA
jgi:hypothetical protein